MSLTDPPPCLATGVKGNTLIDGPVVFDFFNAGLPDELAGTTIGEEAIADIAKETRLRRCSGAPEFDETEPSAVAVFAFGECYLFGEQCGCVAVEKTRVRWISVKKINCQSKATNTRKRLLCAFADKSESPRFTDGTSQGMRRRGRDPSLASTAVDHGDSLKGNICIP
jgi:hypothetical protein